MTKNKIIIIEDNEKHANAIARIFEKDYDIFPLPFSKEFEDLSSCYATYNHPDLESQIRKERAKVISDFLLQYQSEICCFIVDYRLKNTEAKLIKNKSGVEFCKYFRKEMGASPIIVLSSTNQNIEYQDIWNFARDEKKFRQVEFLAKRGNDWMDKPAFEIELKNTFNRLVRPDNGDKPIPPP